MSPPLSIYADFPTNGRIGKAFLQAHFGGRQPMRIPVTRRLKSGLCYQNVRTVVATDAGAVQTGWMLHQIPGQYLEAMHHAVWCRPDGSLEDVTEPVVKGATEISFIPDDLAVPDALGLSVPSKFHQLDEHEGTAHYIELMLERSRTMARQHEMLRKHAEFSPSGEVTSCPLHVVEAINQIGAQAQQIDRKLGSYDEKFWRGDFSKLR